MNEQTGKTNFITSGQWKLLLFTLCTGCFFLLFLFSSLAVHYLGAFLDHFSMVLWPLAIAAILSIVLRPWVELVEIRFRLSTQLSILALYILVVGICAVSIWGIGGEVIRQVRDLAGSSIQWPEKIEQEIRQVINPATWEIISQKFAHFKNLWKDGIGQLVSGMPEITQKSARALQDAWSGVSSFFAFFTCLAIVPVYLFYFLSSKRDYLSDFAGELRFLNKNTRDDLIYLIGEFKGILEGFFRGQLVIGALMGIGYALGFSLCGLKFGIALGLLFGVLNIVPFLGSILGFITVLLVSYLQTGGILETGNWGVLWGCIITFGVVQVLESYWLSPKIMGNKTGLHPVVIIASVFFWGTAFDGVLGMILGIPITAFLTIFWRLLKIKYLRH